MLNEHNVKYLVVGGYAVALHCHPRYTKDLDVWIELSPGNAVNILNALERFGFASLDLRIDDFLVADRVIQLGFPPNRIDLMTLVSGLAFKDCYKARVEVELQGVRVNFIDQKNLKKNKLATGCLQDLADIKNLE